MGEAQGRGGGGRTDAQGRKLLRLAEQCADAGKRQPGGRRAGQCFVRDPGAEELVDITRLCATTVRWFNEKPNIAMVSHSNFGSDTSEGSIKVRKAVEQLHREFPDLAVDGEMQIGYALNREQRDEMYPFTRLFGKDVNTLVFPNLTSAQTSFKLLQALNSDVEILGPIQMGLNKPIYFTDHDASVRDVVNIVSVASVDAYVWKLQHRISGEK